MENNGKIERKFKDYLFNEVTFTIAIFGFAWGIFNYLNTPINKISMDIALIQKDINTIQTNHEVHIQTIMEQLKQLAEEDKQQDESIIRLLQIHNIR